MIVESSGLNPKIDYKDGRPQRGGNLSNLHNVENFNFSDREVIRKVAAYILNHRNKLSSEEMDGLEVVQQNLNRQIARINKSTSGVRGFFNYIFHHRTYSDKEQQLQYLTGLRDFIQTCKPTPSSEPAKAEDHASRISQTSKEEQVVSESPANAKEADPLKDLGAVAPATDFLGILASLTTPLARSRLDASVLGISAFSAAKEVPQVAIDSRETESDSLTNPTEGTESESVSQGPPPPPLNGPPPPPVFNASKPVVKKLTPEELEAKRKKDWDEKEKTRLEKNFKARINPETYIIYAPPQGEKYGDLTRTETALKTLIETTRKVLEDNSEIKDRARLESTLKEAETKLASVQDELKGPKKLLTDSNHPTFQELLKNLTNEELKVIIGMYFRGKKPAKEDANYSLHVPAIIKPYSGPTDTKYDKANAERHEKEIAKSIQSSQITQHVLDDIFNNWDQISTSSVAQAFLEHKEDWEKYLETSKRAFIQTLVKRAITAEATKTGKPLSEKDADYAVEPVHTAKPYERTTNQTAKVFSAPSNADTRAALDLEAIKGFKLKKAPTTETKAPSKKESEEQGGDMISELNKRLKRRDLTEIARKNQEVDKQKSELAIAQGFGVIKK